MSKIFVNTNDIYNYSCTLGNNILKTYKPDVVLGVSRGGCIPGIFIHEYLNFNGVVCEYCNIGCKSYDNNNNKTATHEIDCSHITLSKLLDVDHILIVDDVFDTGLTVMNILNFLSEKGVYSDKIKICTVFYKPKKNKTTIIPDYYVKETDDWIVFPHELVGLHGGDISYKINYENNH